jgi:hypothetical protein
MDSFQKLVNTLSVESQTRATGIALAKALEAQRQGILTAHEVAMMEIATNRGFALPASLCKALAAVKTA